MLPDNYSLTLVTGPVADPVDRAFVKLANRIQSTSEDDLIDHWLRAAVEQVEMDADLKLMPQTWLLKFDGWQPGNPCWMDWMRGAFELPLTPVASISSVKYLDTTNVQRTISSGNYYLEAGSIPPRLLPAPGYTWPATSEKAGAWEITIVAGYADAAHVPARAKQAICLLVGHWNQNRELASDRNTKAVGLSYDRIVQGLRRGFV